MLLPHHTTKETAKNHSHSLKIRYYHVQTNHDIMGFTNLFVFHIVGSCLGYIIDEGMI